MNYLKGYDLCRRHLLVPRGCHLGGLVPPFWQPGWPFWHLGITLEDHESSRMGSQRSVIGSSSISIRFGDRFLSMFCFWGIFLDMVFCCALGSKFHGIWRYFESFFAHVCALARTSAFVFLWFLSAVTFGNSLSTGPEALISTHFAQGCSTSCQFSFLITFS